MYHVLQDFTANAKTISYVLAAVVMLAFVLFWVFLNKRKTRK
jgi:LPXTG-motif cell wall-anchored protein